MSELSLLIAHWKSRLAQNRFLLEPSELFLLEETIRQLESLLKKGDK